LYHFMKKVCYLVNGVATLPSVSSPPPHIRYTFVFIGAAENKICLADPSGYVSLIDVTEIQRPTVIWNEHLGSKIAQIAFSPDGNLLTVLDQQGVLHVISSSSSSSSQLEVKVTTDAGNKLIAFAFASSESIVVSNSTTNKLQFLDVKTATNGAAVGRRASMDDSAWFLEIESEIAGACDLLFSGPGIVIEGTKQGDIRVLGSSGVRDLVWALGGLLTNGGDMAELLQVHPSWAVRILPTSFDSATLLHCAVLFDQLDWIQPLCEHGAHPAQEMAGRPRSSAIDLAISLKKEVSSYLSYTLYLVLHRA
jgi:WD40 repeat protein